MQIFEKPVEGGLIQSHQVNRKTYRVREGGNRKECYWVEPRLGGPRWGLSH